MEEGLIFIILALLFLLIVAVLIKNNNLKNSESNLIQDKDVTLNKVLSALSDFKLQLVEGRKYGFSELDVEKQMENFCKEIFEHVTRQHGVGGTNSKNIDLDIGRGRVGIEIKLAKEVIKEGGNDRLIGQVIKYKSRQYRDNNLIIIVAGMKEEERETSLSDLRDFLNEQKVHYLFFSPIK